MADLSLTEKRNIVRLCKTVQRQLGLADQEYRALLWGAAGVGSSTEISTREQRQRVLDALKRAGWQDNKPTRKPKSPQSRHLPPQWRHPKHKAVALWIELFNRGAVRDGSHAALGNFAQRMLRRNNIRVLPGVDPLEALSEADMARVIEGLKAWLERIGGTHEQST